MIRRPSISSLIATLFAYTTRFRSSFFIRPGAVHGPVPSAATFPISLRSERNGEGEVAEEDTAGRRIQVANARPEDAGLGLARLPLAVMAELHLAEGDVVEIAGKRSTPARVVRPYKED